MTKLTRLLLPFTLLSLWVGHPAFAETDTGGTTTTTASVVEVVSVNKLSATEIAPAVFTVKAKAPDSFWDKLAWCETQGDWKNGGNWAGGLGIARSTWQRFGGKEFASAPNFATKEEQIVVANRISTQGYSGVIQRDPEWAKVHGVAVSEPYTQNPVGFSGWGALHCAGGRPKLYHYDPEYVKTASYVFNQKGLLVKDLQTMVGVRTDGHYGIVTRNAHVSYLRKNHISTSGVAKLPDFLVKGISKDKSKRCPNWEGRLRFYGLQPVDTFSYIMWRESRCNPSSISKLNANGTRDYGLLQINSSWKTATNKICRGKYGDMTVLLKPTCNLQVAKYLFDNGGLNHWSGTSGAPQ